MYDGSSLGWYLPISSITLPSRFLRESTTTMRYCGTRTLPRRFKRILTATFVVSPQMSCGGGGQDARVGHRARSPMGLASPRVRGSGRAGLDRQVCQTGPVPPNPAQPDARWRHLTHVHELSRRRLTERHPWLYPVAVLAHQARRHVAWLAADT